MDIESQATDTTREGPAGQARQYVELGWEQVEHPRKESLLLLYTKGRKSGAYRRTPLIFHFGDEDSVTLIANNGGRPNHPDWYFNLESDPNVSIRYRNEFYDAVAHILDGDEREEVWGRIAESVPHLAESQEGIGRIIPIVRVTRASA